MRRTRAAATKHPPANPLLPGMPCFALRPDRERAQSAMPRRTAQEQSRPGVTRPSPPRPNDSVRPQKGSAADPGRESPVRAGCRTGHERAIPLSSTMTAAPDSGWRGRVHTVHEVRHPRVISHIAA